MTDAALSHDALENRVLREIANLAAAPHEYQDVIQSVLDGVEQVVSSPYLELAIEEDGRWCRYPRIAADVDRTWSAEVERALDEIEFHVAGQPLPGYGLHHLPSIDGWALSFPASTRSNRAMAITLVAPGKPTLSAEEARVMSGIAQQAALVLDHALLAASLDDLQTEDRLTGVLSHSRLLELLEAEIVRHRYFGRPLGMLLVDIDGLDSINRLYGRRYGNHVLQKIAAMLREAARPVDVVGRSGLDEFAVVLPETIDGDAQQIAEDLAERLLHLEFAGGEVRVTIGVSGTRPSENLAADEFLRRAEGALHVAKRHNRSLTAQPLRRR